MKIKLLIALIALTTAASAETKRLSCEFYSEIVTNWTVETTSSGIYNLPLNYPFYSKPSTGVDVGVVSSNYNVSFHLKLQKKTFTLNSVELFRIKNPWKEIQKTEKIYDTPWIITNLWAGGNFYCTNSVSVMTNLYLTNLCVPSPFYASTNNTITNISLEGYNLIFEDDEWKKVSK